MVAVCHVSAINQLVATGIAIALGRTMRSSWLIAATLLVSVPAFADPPGLTEPAPSPSTPAVDSYRLEVFALDAGVTVALVAGNRNGGVVGLALTTYLLGAPILHLMHDRPGTAVASAGLRIGLPLVVGLLGARAFADSRDPDSDGPIAGAALGVMGGAITASAIDIGMFAKGDDRPHVAPAVTPTANGGMTFGLAGSF
jgi:hypothetical protein